MKAQANSVSGAVLPILAYCACSMSMIYTNKLVLSVYDFHYAACLLIFQSVVAVLCLWGLSAMKYIDLEPFSMETAKKWSPVTIFFGLMLYTGSKTITLLSIPVLTVFKNMTNLVIAFGDWYFFGQTVTPGIIGSFVMMTVGSVLVSLYDLEFNLAGYVWMSFNCLSQAAYVLYMRRAKQTTKLSEWGMSFYNNLLCAGLMVLSAVGSGEIFEAVNYPSLSDTGFLSAMIFSGVIGTGLSLSVFWCVNATSPTTYSMVGALNKIPITFISIVFFNTEMDSKLAFSVCVGLLAGLVYTYAKLQLRKSPQPVNEKSAENERLPPFKAGR
ncbi:uncharacterized protein MONBRDRAFT_25661 [Monosiga brevicollis MX1]|uniref:GDP-mannose transporter n=1 Tax=Monosiga brevicollis TaxID=81824 RepID=A9V020_MONBE|nr:uncharacterized protein MONBRDRAFT_25661 [Monosiga brevicollis MX1]EDQ88935.1 predicted protein [Monosiga brevicollis MX1]|eukprot:XP_001746040.1 hypothetical protein [Monosiga brevicollis MX1]